MLDELDKQILEFMLHKSDVPSKQEYNFDSDLVGMAENLKSDPETIRAAVRDLEKKEYVIYIQNQYGIPMRFSLDHKGLHWKEYRRQEIMRYLEEKWIDFFALLVATVALIVSFTNR